MLKETDYMTAKEMSGYLRETCNLVVSRQYILALWDMGCPHIRNEGRPDHLLKWWHDNPNVQPRSRRNRTGSIREI
jgi:hypothetical protein